MSALRGFLWLIGFLLLVTLPIMPGVVGIFFMLKELADQRVTILLALLLPLAWRLPGLVG
ncbi:MAG: hypothetical protein ACLFSR_02600 [Halomonas sp.]